MIDPGDEDDGKTQHEREDPGPEMPERTPQLTSGADPTGRRDFDVDDQERERDGKDTIAERLEPCVRVRVCQVVVALTVYAVDDPVAPFLVRNAADGKWLVSNGGGVEPRWSRDGKELFCFSGQTLMAVPVSVRPTFSNGVPVALFDAPVQPGYTSDAHRWQLAPDGKRFLLLASAGKDEAVPVRVIVNWPALLK